MCLETRIIRGWVETMCSLFPVLSFLPHPQYVGLPLSDDAFCRCIASIAATATSISSEVDK